MPAGTIDKDGIPQRQIVADANVPTSIIKPTGFTETAPGIVTHPIGTVEQSIKDPVERMGAAKPWISKAGHAVAAANAHDPPGSKPSMKVQKTRAKGPGGMVSGGVPAGQQNAGGYASANSIGGYSASQES